MKRKNRRKMKKAIITVTSLLIVLFGAIFLIEGKINNEKEPEDDNPVVEKPRDEDPAEENPTEDPTENPISERPGEETPEEPVNNDNDNLILIESPEVYDVLVNKKRTLSKTYVPQDLVKLTEVPTVLENPEINQLREVAYNALIELFEAAKEEENYELYARSGYRSYGTQESLYNSYVANWGKAAADKFSAKAGQSEHQTGLAMDITCEAMNFQLDETFGETDEGKWVAENAYRFGFIIRYPKGKEDVTGYMYEPWHIRYLGTELAKEVYESGLTLEEYFE
ncbi:D-alanyl-D-alanine carboxypeptidase family protein [Sedimentibacter sp.]|uniref:D-alanyl-D-alanine carboxypeptidase family protein n=1 Tax=Sedimentibacter sp. TaxID=1960295 RepID=UPI0028A0E4E1|nr:D-alanyl-D-alanine carboxypeptidase family protein [Sedimentibacter sp.]